MRRLAFPLAVLLLLPGPRTDAQNLPLEPATRARVEGYGTLSVHQGWKSAGLGGDARAASAGVRLPPHGTNRTPESQASTLRDPIRLWINAGLGLGGSGLAVAGSVSVQPGKHVLSARAILTTDSEEDLADLGLLYGRVLSQGRFHTSLGAGLARAYGSHDSGFWDHDGEGRKLIIGIPLELQLAWRPGRWIGVGVYGFANLNSVQSFGGATLSLQVGKLRGGPSQNDRPKSPNSRTL